MELKTRRLLLMPPCDEDAARITALIGDWRVASMLSRVPYPYPEGGAADWIAKQADAVAQGRAVGFLMHRRYRPGEGAIGGIGLEPATVDQDGTRQAEMGYWLGVPYWGRGYATEAARAVLAHGFAAMALDRVTAGYFLENPASAGVLHKTGFRPTQANPRWCEARACEVACQDMAVDRAGFVAVA